jgi:hypothetical protein
MSLKDEMLKELSGKLEAIAESFSAYVEYVLNEKKVELDDEKTVGDDPEEDDVKKEDKEDTK